MEFDQGQARAVSHRDGPMIVLAGPGSGKTLVITHRTKCLIEEHGIEPSEILVITFTKASAVEMRERFNKLSEGQRYPVNFGTFHAVFFKVLRYAYNLNGNNILREDVKYDYLKEIVTNQNLEIEDLNDFVSDLASEISLVKGDMIDLSHYYAKSCSEDTFKQIFNDYERKLSNANLIDFDDMLVKCYELLKAREDILQMWQQKYKYILIDEFQDINLVQYEIIKMLSKPQDNLFIVGDDDQSIYRFRGAKPEIMLNFENDYKGAQKVLLGTNYRSTKNIVKNAGRVIANNKHRFDKEIVAEHQDGEKIEIKEFEKPIDENIYAVEQINKYIEQGYKYSDIAFLFRTNIGPRQFVEKLMEYNLPFRMKDTLPNMYEHWIAKDMIAYMNIAQGSKLRTDYLRIINKPKRYISRNVFDSAEVSVEGVYGIYEDKKWALEKLDKFYYDMKFLAKMSPYAAINYIRNGIGYDEYLKEYALYRRMKVEDLQELIEELMENSKPYKTYEEWVAHMQEYGEKLKEQVRERSVSSNSIDIITMHGAKGLEYPIVFVLDAIEGVTPHNKAVLEEDVEEERRLFYVAITRAKERLHVYSVKERYNKPVSVSRFVGEMLMETEKIIVGAKVIHKKYGEGIIKHVKSDKMIIYITKLRKELTFDIKFVIGNRIVELVE